MKPVIHKLRSQGIVLIIYLDDILIIGKIESECKKNVMVVRELLESLGFVISPKSQLKPAKICTFLGFIINSTNFCVQLTEQQGCLPCCQIRLVIH